MQSIFQFHKGTIRTECLARLLQVFCHFNSIKVQLERGAVVLIFLYLNNFNSIKVQLEPASGSGSLSGSTFQFHKGTIRTSGSQASYYSQMSFQFHKGTIRTRYPGSGCTHHLDFNSIKVQLELARCYF